MNRCPAPLSLLLALPAAASAAATQESAVPGPGAATLQLLLSLALVLTLLAVLAWAARKLRFAGPRGDGSLRVLADLPLGPRERLLLLQVGDRQALVGVGSGGISSLQLLQEEVRLGVDAAPPAPLAERVRSMLERSRRP